MPTSTTCGREGFFSSAARSGGWRVGQANASKRAALSQVRLITLLMNLGPFAWYSLRAVGLNPTAPRPDSHPRTYFTLAPPRAGGTPRPRAAGQGGTAARAALLSC